MKRDAVYYVMPLGEIWLLRAIGSSAEAYPTFEDALAAAERLAARGARVRVLSRASGAHEAMSPGLATTTRPSEVADAPSVSTTSVTSVSTVTSVASVVASAAESDQDSDPVRRAAS